MATKAPLTSRNYLRSTYENDFIKHASPRSPSSRGAMRQRSKTPITKFKKRLEVQ